MSSLDHVRYALEFTDRYLAGDLYTAPAAAERADEIGFWMLQADGWLSDRVDRIDGRGHVDERTAKVARGVVVAVARAAFGGVLRPAPAYFEAFAERMEAAGHPDDHAVRVPTWARPVEQGHVQ